jgi:WD40 repeat protein
MNEQSAKSFSVFELLAMSWSFDAEPVCSLISRDGKHAGFLLSNGKFAIVRTSDAESPDRRTSIEKETGKATIRPRTTDPIAPLTPDLAVAPHLPIVRYGAQSFALACRDGTVRQVTARGHVIERASPGNGPVTALAGDQAGDRLVYARKSEAFVIEIGSEEPAVSFKLEHPATCLAMHPDGDKFVVWGEGRASIYDWSKEPGHIWSGDCKGDVTAMSWNLDATHIACACSDKALLVINANSGTVQRIDGFPDKVRCAAFNDAGRALVASGAFRLVGWADWDLPKNDEPGTPLASGKAGLVVIETIASHPTKDLVATGYQNGLISVTSIGKPDELLLRNASGEAVTTMSWSPDGEHLSVGDKSGGCSIVTFPEQMFK